VWYLFGIYAAVAGIVLAGIALLLSYTLLTRQMSLVGTLEGVLGIIILVVFLYFLFRFTKYTLGSKHGLGWKTFEAYAVLVLGLVAYGGSIPWGVYMVYNEPKLWPILLISTPFYFGLALLFIRGFRSRRKELKAEINQG
jgi:hypothetical protein